MNTINQKFASLVNGSTHMGSHGIVGTKHEVRQSIWSEFVQEFPTSVTIEIAGVEITLPANTSVSGKSTSYFAGISREEFKAITGSEFGLKKVASPHVAINGGQVTVHGGGKYYLVVDNDKVNIK